MHEVKAKIKGLKSILNDMKKHVENDEYDGILIIGIKANEEATFTKVLGEVSTFEWLGVLEHAKDVIKNGK